MNKQNIILKWLNKEFGNLIPVVKDDRTYYVDKDRLPLFYYYRDTKHGWIHINYDRIWSLLVSVFIMDLLEIRELLSKWLKDVYNLRGLKPTLESNNHFFMLEDTYNLKHYE